MSTENNSNKFRIPSRKSLIYSSITAAVSALIILVTVVLPAEYNIDPTGAGRLLGLTELSQRTGRQIPAANAVTAAGVRVPQSAADMRTSGNHQVPYRTDIIEIEMAPEDELEYKVTLDRGEPLLYSWVTDNENHPVYYDFHGESTAKDGTHPEGYVMSYEEKQEGASSSHGYLIAPFTGNHGWYLLNFNDRPVTVRLKISGNYSWHGYIGQRVNYSQVAGSE